MGGGDAGPHLPGPQNADAADGPRLDVGIGDAPVAGELVLHEEDADQRRRNGRADNAERLLQFDLQRFRQRPVDPVADRPQSRQRGGILSLRRAADGPFGDAEGEVQLVVAEAQRLLFALPERFPLAALLRVVDQPSPLVDEPFAGNRVEHESAFGRFGRADRLAGGDHRDRLLDADDARQPLRSPQPGMMPTLTSGRPIFVAGLAAARR